MHRNQSVSVHKFAMIPRADVPRSAFRIQTAHKTAFNAGDLIPFYVNEQLPGDTFNLHATVFARLATPIFPVMDNLYIDTFFFFVPARLVWTNWVKFMGEQDNPGDSISYVVPTITSPAGGYAVGSIFDYMGLPTAGQVAPGNTISHNALPLRAYNLIWNEWFRDENLQNSVTENKGDGPDAYTDYTLKKRGKRHDYFTSALPWPQKGNTAVSLPLGTMAPIKWSNYSGNPTATDKYVIGTQTAASTFQAGPTYGSNTGAFTLANPSNSNMYADLSQATAATINQLRQAFQIQKLLERDARGGTRYTEIVWSHFGVKSPDARLQRPEYLGGGSTPITVAPIAQTSGTNASGTTTPLGNLAAMGNVVSHNGFKASFVEHGYVIGLASVRADLNYQQGMRKMWNRSTRYDFYFPAFAMLGEQAILNKEIYCDGSANDNNVFGYQERWAEYRYHPTQITGLMRSTSASTIDAWHLAQRFGSLPTLNDTFIQDPTQTTLQRVLAVGSGAAGQQLIVDTFIDIKAARPLPLYSVPGLIDHF